MALRCVSKCDIYTWIQDLAVLVFKLTWVFSPGFKYCSIKKRSCVVVLIRGLKCLKITLPGDTVKISWQRCSLNLDAVS